MKFLKVFFLLTALTCFLHSCTRKNEEEKAFNFLFSGQWDSLRNHVDHSNGEFEYLLGLPSRMEGKYEFSLTDGHLILKGRTGSVDTINYSWELTMEIM